MQASLKESFKLLKGNFHLGARNIGENLSTAPAPTSKTM